MQEKRSRRKGLVIVFTGEGKGKTTAAMGMALRAVGHKLSVLVIQFIKGTGHYGELEAAKGLTPYLEVVRSGLGFTVGPWRKRSVSQEEHKRAADEALALARERMLSGKVDMLILDEILGAIGAGLVTPEVVLALIAEKPPDLHLVLTGRGAPQEIIEAADLVTEMREVKHPYRQGIIAQRGVEF